MSLYQFGKDVYVVQKDKPNLTAIKLRQCRNNCKLSQQQVADTLGINRSTYSYYELGRSQPDLETLVKLAQIFRVEPSSLLPNENAEIILSENDSEAVKPIYSLTREEQNLLISFRLLSDFDKADFLAKITNKANGLV